MLSWEQGGYGQLVVQELPQRLVPFPAVPANHPRLSDSWEQTQCNSRQYLCCAGLGTDSEGLCCADSDTYRARCGARLYRDTCSTLPLSGSTLLSPISIIREHVRREAGLISCSKAPCQLGNLHGARCASRYTHCDRAFLSLCSPQVFHYAQELLTAEATHPVTWEQTAVIPQFLMLLFWREGILQIEVWCTLPLRGLRQVAVFLCIIFFKRGRSYYVCHVFGFFFSIALHSILSSWRGGEEEHGANNSFTTSLYLPHLKILSRWKEFICKQASRRLTEGKW